MMDIKISLELIISCIAIIVSIRLSFLELKHRKINLQLQSELDRINSKALKYHDGQFNTYLDIWEKLFSIKTNLTEIFFSADPDSLRKFFEESKKLNKVLGTAYVLCDKDIYNEIVSIQMKMAEVIVSRIEKDDKESYSDITQELIENFNNKFFLLGDRIRDKINS